MFMAQTKHHGTWVAYYDVRSHRRADQALSEDQQKDTIRTTLNGGTWSLLREFTENMGKQSRRPMLQEALALCRAQSATLIMATIDPLLRNRYFLTLVRDSGVPLMVCDAPDVDFTHLRVLARYAEKEAGVASVSIKRGIEKAKAKGVRLGSPRPTAGAARSGEVVQMKADRHAKRVLPIIKKLRAEGHATFREIAQALNEMGVETARGGEWFASTVRNIEKREMEG